MSAIARCPHHECITYSDGDCSACVYIGQTKDVSALLVLQFCSWTRRHYYIKFLKRCRSTQIVEFRQWTWCCFSRVRPWFFLCTRMVCACIDAACIHPCSWLCDPICNCKLSEKVQICGEFWAIGSLLVLPNVSQKRSRFCQSFLSSSHVLFHTLWITFFSLQDDLQQLPLYLSARSTLKCAKWRQVGKSRDQCCWILLKVILHPLDLHFCICILPDQYLPSANQLIRQSEVFLLQIRTDYLKHFNSILGLRVMGMPPLGGHHRRCNLGVSHTFWMHWINFTFIYRNFVHALFEDFCSTQSTDSAE